MKTTFKILKTDNHEYPVSVQVFGTINGIEHTYCGIGRFCRTFEEAEHYISTYNIKKPIITDLYHENK